MKYDTVLFDLDGTLLDTSKGILKSVDFTIAKLGYRELTVEEKRSFIGPPIQYSLQKTFNLSDEEKDFAAAVFRERYSKTDLFEAEVYEGILPLLKALKSNDFKIGIATYKREDYAKILLDKFEITKYCDCVIGSDFAGKYTKQDIINLCINNLKGSTDGVIMIGDTENDRIGAKRANVDFLAVTYGFGYKVVGIDSTIAFCETPKEIYEFLIGG